MDERCATRLLPDSPADADAFGSHERVAGAIAEVVQTESGGKAIGLEGGWGAGKSTIVKLIAQKLSQAKERAHKIAVFDMWSHQGDPLRRTFLENLIKQVQRFRWVDKEQWDRRIDELAKRRREETTRVVPRLTPEGVKFAFSLLAVPNWVSSIWCWSFAIGLQGCLRAVESRAYCPWYSFGARPSDLLRLPRSGRMLEEKTQGQDKRGGRLVERAASLIHRAGLNRVPYGGVPVPRSHGG